jgi:hypothetical protein
VGTGVEGGSQPSSGMIDHPSDLILDWGLEEEGNSEALEVESEKSPASLATRRRDGPAFGDSGESGRGICSGDSAGCCSAVRAPAWL